MVGLEAVQSDLNRRDFRVVLPILVFNSDPEEARYIVDLFWVVQEQLLVKVWILVVFNHD